MLRYRNELRTLADLQAWVPEGPFTAEESPDGLLLSARGDEGHWVLWSPEVFGDRIRIAWEFSPRAEPGLAMLFFGATALDGPDVLGASPAPPPGPSRSDERRVGNEWVRK